MEYRNGSTEKTLAPPSTTISPTTATAPRRAVPQRNRRIARSLPPFRAVCSEPSLGSRIVQRQVQLRNAETGLVS
eukprot:m.161108 g.161108  ORF g.161108 m.161108 type:complete len:75 (+) comp14569_c0_seq4:5348-5572(+)